MPSLETALSTWYPLILGAALGARTLLRHRPSTTASATDVIGPALAGRAVLLIGVPVLWQVTAHLHDPDLEHALPSFYLHVATGLLLGLALASLALLARRSSASHRNRRSARQDRASASAPCPGYPADHVRTGRTSTPWSIP
ncbi:hypothetical protein [Streptomyces sp. WM6378]|uniref:hypothetical protein n=1 Tax=Streptomyces sp. WM6378 TaxID=1415557 RepID=UPI0006ADC9A8|nr:hypothetical protein [Streptomyces sp. WM6378]KOU37628.1 hypothetical protein ADK54_31445 [Streptomyces sp. WM6378]